MTNPLKESPVTQANLWPAEFFKSDNSSTKPPASPPPASLTDSKEGELFIRVVKKIFSKL